MKIILKEDVKKLGKKGEVKEVSEGYARNFLFPKKLAGLATDASIKSVEIMKEKEKELARKQKEEALSLLSTLQGKKITIRAKDRKGKLFGSILAKDIANELAKENIVLDEKRIKIENSIKKIGNYTINIILGNDMETKLALIVESDN